MTRLLAALLAPSLALPAPAVLGLGALALAPRPARAEAAQFTPAQRQEIVAILRQALKADPSILRDAVAALQQDDARHDAAAAAKAIAANRAALFADPADPVAGDPRGDVTVVEFYDPRCPYCRRMLPVVDGLLKADPHVRLVYKDIPVLGPASVLEARAILAAQRQGAYLRMQRALMTDSVQPSEQTIHDTAASLGLDADRLVRDMNSPGIAARLAANLKLARALDVQGTPVVVVGEQMIAGAVEMPELQAAVTAARKAAKQPASN